MISKFFIDRPVFATVVSLVILLLGGISIFVLPIAQFPEIVPPTVQVATTYQGASAETVAQSVAAPIEQQLSGAKNLIYYSSQSANDGTMSLTATFEIGSDQDIAAVDVQNRLSIAQPRLPQDVVRQGIPVTKRSSNLLCVVALKSSDAQYDDVYLSNYATINVVDALKRIPGAGDVLVFGAKDYAMRIWVNPDRLAQKTMTVSDVASAVREQNAVFAAGRIGQSPNEPGAQLTLPVLTRGRFDTATDYENIILRANPDGSMIRLRDVARVELGSQSYDLFGRLGGQPTTLVLVYLQTGANALNTVAQIRAAMDSMSRAFPKGVEYDVPYDTTKFVQVSIDEVVQTLLEAIGLVLVVLFVFLQSWRATIIPLVAVPVSIIGTFAGMLALGFSINTLTLFGMVLAIGIVVDDAIVVIENVDRIMETENLPIREATIKAMEEVTGPIIATSLVLAAVFVPVGFLGGFTGELYKQFAVTIAVSVLISSIVALTLSPAMCRIVLRPTHGRKKFILFRWFNAGFDRLTRGYTGAVRIAIRGAIGTVLVFGAVLFGTYTLFQRVPSGFIPDEDQGYIISVVLLPDGASLERTDALVRRVERFYLDNPNVQNVVTLGGYDLLSGGVNSTNAAVMFVPLKPWDQRKNPDQHAKAMIGAAWGAFGAEKDGLVLTFNPPAIQGLGQRAGFEFQLQSRESADVRSLAAAMDKFLAKARERPEIAGLNSPFRVTQPQLFVDLDRTKTKMMGVRVNEVFDAMQAYLGALYVNDFDKFGRIWRVQLQAEPEFRKNPEDIRSIYVRNDKGNAVPLGSVVSTRFQAGPNIVSRFNGFPSVQITGAPAPGYSTGQAMAAMRETAESELPPGFGYEWSGASFQEVKSGDQAPKVLAFGLLVVFLVLSAQYEKWSLPIAVLLAVPVGIFGALLAVFIRGIDRDIYFQIGLLTLVGLAAKNAILIVEFCVFQRAAGKTIVEAAIEAARLRLRPIVMTSLAFILGVIPLVISTGAGAAGRHSIGTGVMGGMITATFLAVFFVPVFYVLIQRFSEAVGGKKNAVAPGGHAGPPQPPAAAH